MKCPGPLRTCRVVAAPRRSPLCRGAQAGWAGPSAEVLALGAVASPVGKVVTMLEAMARKGKEELQEERVQYARWGRGRRMALRARYAQWCEATKAEKAGAVEEATGKMEAARASGVNPVGRCLRRTSRRLWRMWSCW